MKLVSENINEGIKHLKPKTEKEIEENLSNEVSNWINNDNIIDGVFNYLDWTYDTDNREALVEDIFRNIDKKVLQQAIIDVITNYLEMNS